MDIASMSHCSFYSEAVVVNLTLYQPPLLLAGCTKFWSIPAGICSQLVNRALMRSTSYDGWESLSKWVVQNIPKVFVHILICREKNIYLLLCLCALPCWHRNESSRAQSWRTHFSKIHK